MERVLSPAKRSPRMEEILDAAAKIFYEKGYHATTIEDVAREVGMLKGSLYYYIRSKEDLLYELLLQVIRQGDERLVKAIQGVTDAEECLERALGAGIEHIIRNQTRVGLFLHEFDSLSGERQKRIQEEITKYHRRFVDIVRQGQAAGQFVEGDPWLLVNGILGVVNWIYRWHPGGSKGPRVELVKQTFVSLIINGLRPRAKTIAARKTGD